MELGKLLQLGLIVCFVVGSLCMPSKRVFLNIDCDRRVVCPKILAPICCTDGNTYNTKCELEMENQKRICHEGQFNPIAKVYDGPCTTPAPTSTPAP